MGLILKMKRTTELRTIVISILQIMKRTIFIINLQIINNDLDYGEDVNNSVNNVKDSNDHEDSDFESDDSRTNPKPVKSRFNKNTLEDSDKNMEIIELLKVKIPYNLPCKECKTHRHKDEC